MDRHKPFIFIFKYVCTWIWFILIFSFFQHNYVAIFCKRLISSFDPCCCSECYDCITVHILVCQLRDRGAYKMGYCQILQGPSCIDQPQLLSLFISSLFVLAHWANIPMAVQYDFILENFKTVMKKQTHKRAFVLSFLAP